MERIIAHAVGDRDAQRTMGCCDAKHIAAASANQAWALFLFIAKLLLSSSPPTPAKILMFQIHCTC